VSPPSHSLIEEFRYGSQPIAAEHYDQIVSPFPFSFTRRRHNSAMTTLSRDYGLLANIYGWNQNPVKRKDSWLHWSKEEEKLAIILRAYDSTDSSKSNHSNNIISPNINIPLDHDLKSQDTHFSRRRSISAPLSKAQSIPPAISYSSLSRESRPIHQRDKDIEENDYDLDTDDDVDEREFDDNYANTDSIKVERRGGTIMRQKRKAIDFGLKQSPLNEFQYLTLHRTSEIEITIFDEITSLKNCIFELRPFGANEEKGDKILMGATLTKLIEYLTTTLGMLVFVKIHYYFFSSLLPRNFPLIFYLLIHENMIG